MKKVVIVNCFDTYEERIDLLYEFFTTKGFHVTVIQSDFRHFKKIHRQDKKKDFQFIRTKPYYKNMSVSRLTSHYQFAKSAFKTVEGINPDLLYVLIPPNSLTKFAAQYKQRNIKTKLIFDLIDLWPETMPLGKINNYPPFTFWGALRNKNLKYADIVITECNLYQEILEDVLREIKTNTLYLAKKDIEVTSSQMLDNNEIHLCYLGSINNIIDIEKIKSIIRDLNKSKPTTLHIIGDGESKEVFINEIKETGSKVIYHGKIYDPQKKQNIFDRCHFGINIMKDSVCVGLTMKSIDYFQHGLPIINNIQADTTKVIEQNNIGVNLNGRKAEDIIKKIISVETSELIEMKVRTYKVFKDMFSQKSFNSRLDDILNIMD